ncbi:hypothetical protein Tco_0115098 [Tanacetum coccineum]
MFLNTVSYSKLDAFITWKKVEARNVRRVAWTEKIKSSIFLKERRLMRSFEMFVGGRLYEGVTYSCFKGPYDLSIMFFSLGNPGISQLNDGMSCLEQHQTQAHGYGLRWNPVKKILFSICESIDVTVNPLGFELFKDGVEVS